MSAENGYQSEAVATESIPLSTASMDKQNRTYDTFQEEETNHRVRPKESFKGLSGGLLVTVCVNTMFGPGMLAIPKAFQDGGWLPSISILAFMAVATYMTSQFLEETLSRTKHTFVEAKTDNGEHQNPTQNEELVLEFADLTRIHFGSANAEKCSVFLLSLCLMALAIAQMIVVAQALDGLVVYVFGYTCAIDYEHFPPSLAFSTNSGLTPFGVNKPVISLGFGLAMCVCTFLGTLDLSENVKPQLVAICLFLVSTIEFVRCFLMDSNLISKSGWLTQNDDGWSSGANVGLQTRNSHENGTSGAFMLDRKGEGLQMFGCHPWMILGVIVFNFAIVITVPSLFADVQKGTSTSGPVGVASAIMFVIYAAVGITGAGAVPNAGSDFFSYLTGDTIPTTTRLSVFMFVVSLMLSVPVYTILVIRNLIQMTGRPTECKIVGAVLPWLVAMFLYTSDKFGSFLNWTSLLVMGFANYTLPLAITMAERIGSGQYISFWEALRMDGTLRAASMLNLCMTGLIALAITISIRNALVGSYAQQ
mmetsp:Transcript_34615/g.83762  ORF Transcript_34615/g.83762 Transcript_34615/m.83762 type:complete len:534 (-) Transcript_34615:417-2018(-)|eukprot:CAMPEP_0114511222 /NCGR_PEP_ID=MMETSP0109-20121206/14232_1 /TAXON_ID=29199 /ORGANISM="Chlorarachnion reptans, Strain CCCM449" /LENGTH=533 /DNA_ID=CAMNT_0001690635 /DNA_START=283 /DNA_END=1884 /DNA_ORIENTATION=+